MSVVEAVSDVSCLGAGDVFCPGGFGVFELGPRVRARPCCGSRRTDEVVKIVTLTDGVGSAAYPCVGNQDL